MNSAKATIIIFLIVLLQSCGDKKQATTSTSESSIIAFASTFRVKTFRDLVEAIPADEFQDLLEKGETNNWKLEKKSSNGITIQHKQYGDNQVNFLAIYAEGGKPVLITQQVNAQVVVTQGWVQSSADYPWKEVSLPRFTAQQFIAENVILPDGNEDLSAYLDISLENEKITCAVNEWTFSHELESSYAGIDASSLDSFFKYYFEINWNGKEFGVSRMQKKDYSEILNITATVETVDPDGPGATEFDCHDGYAVEASSELKPSANVNYAVKNILRDDGLAWSEGNPGDGTNEWIQFYITGNFLIGNSYQFRNGYVKTKTLWNANNRVKKFSVLLNEKHIATITLKDSDEYQSFNIIAPFMKALDVKKGDKVKFVIREIYKGDKYDDTVVSYFVPQGNCG